ncbi:MAG: terminase large subunit, partial [Niameybacter sp.]
MKRHKFKKKQLALFFSFLTFESFKWQIEAVWQFYKNDLNEFHLTAPRQNGKSQILVLIVLVELFLNDAKITFTSHSTKNCDEFFQKIKHEINSNEDFVEQVDRMINTKGGQLITLKNGSKISFIARTKDGGIGDSNDVIIFDEFQLMNTKQVSAIFPTLAARPDSITIYAGTAPRSIDDDTFYREQRKNHYGKPSWIEYGIGHEYDLEYLKKHDLFLDKDLLKKANPSYGIMIPYKNIVREFGKMDVLDYAIQRLGMFHTQTQKAIFNQNAINKVLIGQEEAQEYKGKFIIG